MTNQPTYNLQEIPNGKAGTSATLNIMAGLIRTYKKAPAIRELAIHLTNNLQQKDWAGEVSVIHRFVRDRVRYVKDIAGVETIQTPIQTLRLGAGDCDDKTILVGALLQAIAHPVKIVAVGTLPNTFMHVYPETKIGGRWVSVETTEPVNIGWKPSGIKARMERNI